MDIFTIGYEGCELGGFVERLQGAEVRLVIDVREAPISRKRGFSKKRLADLLHQARIDYAHFRSLGCPKVIRDRYRVDRDWDAYTVAFMAHLAEQATAISEVAALCAAQQSALLCFEADPQRCHRTYVARAVAAVGRTRVCHMRGCQITSDLYPAPVAHVPLSPVPA